MTSITLNSFIRTLCETTNDVAVIPTYNMYDINSDVQLV